VPASKIPPALEHVEQNAAAIRSRISTDDYKAVSRRFG